ncbi:MAG: immunity protein Tsi6 family protein [Pseudoxanthomonas sp.]
MAEITNISEFTGVLDATIAELDALVGSEPDYPVWRILQQQLHALRDWSKNNATQDPNKRNAITIGLIAARELEPAKNAWMQDLIDHLHALNYFWRYWPSGPPAIAARSWNGFRQIAVAVLILVALAAGSLVAFRVARTEEGPAITLGKSVLIPGATATLTSALEPYTISLNHRPETERYLIQLRLTDPGHHQPDRLVDIAKHMQVNDLRFDVRLLGDDGSRLWFYVGRVGAWDYRHDRLVDADDLRRANPTLATFKPKDNRGDPLISPAVTRIDQTARDIWSGESRLYQFNGRLEVTTPDYAGTYAIDPETLRAELK